MISVILPTRGRPALAQRFLRTAIQTANNPDNIEFLLYVDDDDIPSRDISCDSPNFYLFVGPRSTMGHCNTYCLKRARGDIIVLANDDVVIRTVGWDDKIRMVHNSFSDQIYLAYPNDLNKKSNLSAFPILSRKACHLLSEPFPKIYKGAFIDTHLMEIFIRLRKLGNNRIIYMSDVVFEHLHFRTGKVEIDQTYKDRDRFADDMIFLSLNKTRKATARFLALVIEGKLSDIDGFAYSEPAVIQKPLSVFDMCRLLAGLYLIDSDLPLKLRIRNFVYYVARWVASSVKIFK